MSHPEPDARPRSRFDGFELLRRIAEGGMGAVHLARDVALDRLVAIKFISATLADPLAQQRLLREARVIARLQHPNIVAIYRTGEVEGRPYIAYEYVEGRPLSDLPRPLPWLRALRVGLGLSRGLAAAHRAGILHRDIKPANAMLAHSGEVKLLDFGLAEFTEREAVEQRQLDDWLRSSSLELRGFDDELAGPASSASSSAPASLEASDRAAHLDEQPTRSVGTATDQGATARSLQLYNQAGQSTVRRDGARLTSPGMLMGTPLFLAPELWRGAPATRRSDLYALGLVLYELLAGSLPHARLTTPAIARFVTSQDLPLLADRLPSLPRAFVELIDRCTARDPRQRPESADAVRDALEALAAVYLPFIDTGVDETSADGARVSASFLRVSALGPRLAAAFYERLFALDPALRELFASDLSTQHRMLTAALKLIVDNLQRPERMVPYLMELGRRHARYHVLPGHLSVMGRALLDTLAQLDEKWDDATAMAWSQAYGHIAQIVQRGIEEGEGKGEGHGTRPSEPRSLPRARWELPLVTPQTQWAAVDGGDVAYQSIGRGSPGIVVLGEWVTHLEQTWQHPVVARFFRQLASFARVVLLDRRGCGLSSRNGPISLDHGLADLRAVLDAAGLDRPVLLGIGDGCSTAALFAALRPERTRALVLFAGGRCRSEGGAPSEDAPDELLLRQLRAVRAQWGTPMYIDALAPSLVSDASYRRWWAGTLRQAASPGEAAALWRLGALTRPLSVAHGVRVPTLVLHRTGDRFRPAADSRELAARIPGARYVELAGADHVPWAGDHEAVLEEIHRFLGALVTPPASSRIVGCILAVRAAAGAESTPALRELFAGSIVRAHGHVLHGEPPEAGDELTVLGFFDGPRRALGCALALTAGERGTGRALRIAVDIGLVSADTAAEGEAVARAAALAGEAAPGEILASPAIRELCEGADLEFAEAPSARAAGFRVSRATERML
ncbi:MAG: alpha/beta fold hydrolase [Polyangia bacterium]